MQQNRWLSEWVLVVVGVAGRRRNAALNILVFLLTLFRFRVYFNNRIQFGFER